MLIITQLGIIRWSKRSNGVEDKKQRQEGESRAEDFEDEGKKQKNINDDELRKLRTERRGRRKGSERKNRKR